jgi:hypothetical protein
MTSRKTTSVRGSFEYRRTVRSLGRSRDWVKIKNIAHPAIERAMLIALSKRRPA